MTRSGDKRAAPAKAPRTPQPAANPPKSQSRSSGGGPAETFGRFLGALARLEGAGSRRAGKPGEGSR